MKNLLRKHLKLQRLAYCALICCFVSCSDENDGGVAAYDPNKPLVLTDFYPKEGKLSTQVILEGENFGNNAENVTVYFNDKSAAVISAKGEKILVLAPRRASTVEDPMCTITVQVGEQSAQYSEQFDYEIQTNVTTLVGGNTNATDIPTGTVSLSEAQFSVDLTRVMCVDASKNVFFTVDSDSYAYYYMLNEEAGEVRLLASEGLFLTNQILSYDYHTDLVYVFQANVGYNDIKYFDSANDFEYMTLGSINWDDDEFISTGTWGDWGTKQNFTMGPDGWFYCFGGGGNLMRVNPTTRVGNNMSKGGNVIGTSNGRSYGLVFDPNDDNVFYFSVADESCIYKYDLDTDECVVWAGQQGNAGFLDGPIGECRMNYPQQMCVDSEGNIIFCDLYNHCIRKITMSTGYVSTIAGIPQESGYVNGTLDDAKFYEPVGICIDSEDVMYIGDSKNRAIRRLAIE